MFLLHPDALRAPPSAIELVTGFLVAGLVPPGPARAGLTDAVPANLRSTGSGAFNITSIVFGSAAAPVIVSAVATQFGGNYRVAFSIVMPIAFVGTFFLLAARRHIERDTARRDLEAVAAADGRKTEANAGMRGS